MGVELTDMLTIRRLPVIWSKRYISSSSRYRQKEQKLTETTPASVDTEKHEFTIAEKTKIMWENDKYFDPNARNADAEAFQDWKTQQTINRGSRWRGYFTMV